MYLEDHDQRRLVPKLVEAIEAIPFTEGDWKHLAYATGTDDFVLSHPRLLRSLHWRDEDYGTHVFAAVEHILADDSQNISIMLAHAKLAPWMKEHAPDLYAEFADDGGAVPPFQADASARSRMRGCSSRRPDPSAPLTACIPHSMATSGLPATTPGLAMARALASRTFSSCCASSIQR